MEKERQRKKKKKFLGEVYNNVMMTIRVNVLFKLIYLLIVLNFVNSNTTHLLIMSDMNKTCLLN